MKRQLLIAGAGIVLILGQLAGADSARAATEVKKSAVNERTNTTKADVPRSDITKSPPSTRQTAATLPPPQTGKTASTSANYQIPWLSINSGGGPTASPNYQANVTAGQAAVGTTSSPNYTVGQGYWYGAPSGSGGCSCPYQSDFDQDGFLTALDLAGMIDVLFAGQPDVQDPDCPSPRADFDCDGFSTALDLSGLIDHLFAGGGAPCDPCAL